MNLRRPFGKDPSLSISSNPKLGQMAAAMLCSQFLMLRDQHDIELTDVPQWESTTSLIPTVEHPFMDFEELFGLAYCMALP